MDLTSALLAYDAVIDRAREEGRLPTTVDKIYALRAAFASLPQTPGCAGTCDQGRKPCHCRD